MEIQCRVSRRGAHVSGGTGRWGELTTLAGHWCNNNHSPHRNGLKKKRELALTETVYTAKSLPQNTRASQILRAAGCASRLQQTAPFRSPPPCESSRARFATGVNRHPSHGNPSDTLISNPVDRSPQGGVVRGPALCGNGKGGLPYLDFGPP